MHTETKRDFSSTLYRFRWWATALALALAIGSFLAGSARLGAYSSKVDVLKGRAPGSGEPRVFDPRTDVWFNAEDVGLQTYRDIQRKFIAEDTVILAFEDNDSEWGVFSPRALAAIQRLSEEVARAENVRSVRSLSAMPWVRWGDLGEGETGFVVSDLFQKPIAEYSEDDRIRRMIAVLGTERARAMLGDARIDAAIAREPRLERFNGEPRAIDTIVSKDGHTAAILAQVLRSRPTPSALDASFGEPASEAKEVAATLVAVEGQGAGVDAIREIVARETEYHVYLSGLPVLERYFPQVVQKDMVYLGGMFIIIALVLVAVFRSVTGLLAPMAVVVITIVATQGFSWIIGDMVNNLTAIVPIVLTAVCIGDAVHLVTSYYELRPHHTDKRALITEVLRANSRAVFLTSATTAIGFLSLLTSEVLPIRILGYTSGIGVIVAYVLSMTLVPAALSLVPMRRGAVAPKSPRGGVAAPADAHWSRAIVEWSTARYKGVIAGSLLLIVVCAVGASRIVVDTDLRISFPPSDEVIQALRWIEHKLTGTGDLDIVFYGSESSETDEVAAARQPRLYELKALSLTGAASPAQLAELAALEAAERQHRAGRIAVSAEFLQRADQFERRLIEASRQSGSKLAVLADFDSGLDVLRKINQVQNEESVEHYRIPTLDDVPVAARTGTATVDEIDGSAIYLPPQDASSLAAQYLLQYESGAKPSQNLSSLIAPDQRQFRIAVRVGFRSSEEVLAAYEEIESIARHEFPDIAGSKEDVQAGKALASMSMTGKHYLVTKQLRAFNDTLVMGLATAILSITLVFAAVFRSLRLAAVSMIPNVIPLVLPLAAMGWLGVPLDGSAVVVATIALGVVVDDTIHVLNKYDKERRRGVSPFQAIETAYQQVGSALSWMTLILALGFGVLIMSDFRPNMLIGILGASMIVLGWLVEMLVTPATLYLAAKWSTRVEVAAVVATTEAAE
jgi:predicted RND superfamily exporter protein